MSDIISHLGNPLLAVLADQFEIGTCRYPFSGFGAEIRAKSY